MEASRLQTMACLCAKALSDDEGSELVEFAFSACIVLGCLFAILYCSLALYANHFVANAAREGARYAMVRGSSWGGVPCATVNSFNCTATEADVASFVKSTLTPGLSPEKLTVFTTWPGTTASGASCETANGSNSPYCSVEVNVSYSFESFLPFIPNTINFSNSFTVTITQ